MRNPPHDLQTWSKELSKPPLTKEGYTKGLYKYNISWPYNSAEEFLLFQIMHI